MQISKILNRFNGKLIMGAADRIDQLTIFNVVSNNNHVTMGSAFCAVRSSAWAIDDQTGKAVLKADRRAEFARDAIRRGAQLIIASPSFDPTEMGLDSYQMSKAYVIQVSNPGKVFAQLDALLRPLPEISFAAVTGTNGKSSTVSILRDILRHAGRNAYSGGTLGVIGARPLCELTDVLTTPEVRAAHDAFNTLYRHLKATDFVLEASSQGLVEGRLAAIPFSVAAFTNFTRDHIDTHTYDPVTEVLDEHGAMKRYFECKLSLFVDHLVYEGTAVLNRDMPPFQDVLDHLNGQRPDLSVVTFGSSHLSDMQFTVGQGTARGQRLQFTYKNTSHSVELPLFGKFQAENASAAVTMAVALGVSFSEAVEALAAVSSVPGRMELVGQRKNGARVFVDYAHTDDAVLRSVQSAVSTAAGKPVSIVLGCGGDRDRGKRRLMGRATSGATTVYATDDNPRTEDPASIRAEFIAGASENEGMQIIEIGDRAEAIRRAVLDLPPNGVLLICGKGHESYQEIAAEGKIGKTRRIPFSDQEAVREVLETSFKRTRPPDKEYS
ncbi:Mur ligase family protein [Tateyamaria sp.]|uniref:Mur ligase family protein n=1 Tax=Tateyamaria sp. TaxID=1929288 RepID=UPI00329FD3D2